MPTKEQIRSQIKRLRSKLSPAEREQLSSATCTRLLGLENCLLSPDKAILGYLALQSELTIDPLLYHLKDNSIRVGITVVSGQELLPCELPQPDSLRTGNFNLREPNPDAIVPLPLPIIDCVILPGVAFDYRGYRVGYGKGYYDRFLSKFGKLPLLVGAAFDFQIYESLPTADHDIPVDYIVTPTRLLCCKI